MIYPDNFETKVGFDKIRELISTKCLSPTGKEYTGNMSFSDNHAQISDRLETCREFIKLLHSDTDFPCDHFYDLRPALKRIRVAGSHIETDELFNLRRSLETIAKIVKLLGNESDDDTPLYPKLKAMAENIGTYPDILKKADSIIDRTGNIKDSASPLLQTIRREINSTLGSISRSLANILKKAQSEGYIDKETSPTMRDGRLVIPVNPSHKRKIRGIVHDESASGKTIFIEPAEVVEANNKIRELENDEKRETIRILTEFADTLRPYAEEMTYSYLFLGEIDFIRAKAILASEMKAQIPRIDNYPQIEWYKAIHPLLQISLKRHGKEVVPLDIKLDKNERILLISGPNAGGKSVCLKSVGLLQYMLQCGIPVPMNDNSRAGIFRNILIDIGDEQSIEDDLSTYSSHLLNMKQFVKNCDENTLLLIDEFGGGTEPRIGGAIAEALLDRFNRKRAFGVITTHYQNLKQFAEDNDGIVNGAMLYDRHRMQPLFKLSIGNPGSSFAIEIARKIGLPEDVIAEASEIVGKDYVSMDKYLQDIVRDKQYWEHKRQNAKLMEKRLEELTGRYEKELMEIDRERREVIKKAKGEAEQLIDKANAKIENTIRQIRESQAEKEKTKALREEMRRFKEETGTEKDYDDKVAKKIAKLNDKKKKKRQTEKQAEKQTERPFMPGDAVRLKGESTVGEILSCDDKNAIVAFGMIKTKVNKERLEHASRSQLKKQDTRSVFISPSTMDTVRNKQLNFSREIDIRGMRGDEAIEEVAAFIDTAILSGCNTLRILHGTGNGILQQLVRQYLKKIPAIKSFRDEDIQLGGAGITVIELE